MRDCPNCQRSNPDDATFCAACASRLAGKTSSSERLDHGTDGPETDSDAPTLYEPESRSQMTPRAPARPSSSGASTGASWIPSDPSSEPNFQPGAILAQRYRIIGKLGKGGMGEVYRADDLKLGQPVALKFLPDEMAQHPDRLNRFLGEVRIARQVSHANVCRVYDIIDQDGHFFISMEYIDGEDLGSLLRRIGRLPKDKALENARQVCAGLAAAHDIGVLHRDLKPANIMIDGRGIARIADFGLAGIGDEIVGAEIRAGTPGYMAPEQMSGEQVSVQSDIYSLGLVLHEMFTGQRLLDGKSLEDIRKQQSSLPSSPSDELADLDPAIERAIRRCIEPDPSRRPRSALGVAAALPGGDPVAAALAAGEVPSPEMVAALGDSGALEPMIAVLCLVAVILGVGIEAFLSPKTRYHEMVRLEKPPLVLQTRAVEILETLGYSNDPTDSAWGWFYGGAINRQIVTRDSTATRWETNLRKDHPSAMTFWYRDSPRNLSPKNLIGQVTPSDPPRAVSGMRNVYLSPSGKLLGLQAIPPQVDSLAWTGDEPDWSVVFEAAGLDIANFDSVEPTWNPEMFAHTRAAWTGTKPDSELELRVFASSYRDRIVDFDILYPWSQPGRMWVFEPNRSDQISQAAITTIIILVMIGSVFIARRNYKLGRGDRKGAMRLALFAFTFFFLSYQFRTHRTFELNDEWENFIITCGLGLFIGGFVYGLYMAVEPYVRRLWPDTLISWTRLLQGQFRDPRIGRDFLIGAVAASLLGVMRPIHYLVMKSTGNAPPIPQRVESGYFEGAATTMGQLMNLCVDSLWIPMAFLVVIILMRTIVRRHMLSVVLAYGLIAFFIAIGSSSMWQLAGTILVFAGLFVLQVRFGLLSLIGFFFVTSLMDNLPITLQFSDWYAGPGVLALLLILGLTGFAFYSSLGGRSVVDRVLIEDR